MAFTQTLEERDGYVCTWHQVTCDGCGTTPPQARRTRHSIETYATACGWDMEFFHLCPYCPHTRESICERDAA